MDPKFREFFDFISGIPNTNLHISTFRKKIVDELENYKKILKLNDFEKEQFWELGGMRRFVYEKSHLWQLSDSDSET